MQEMLLQQLKAKIQKNVLLSDLLLLILVKASGGSAPIEKADAGDEFNRTKFVKREEIKSDRPELVPQEL